MPHTVAYEVKEIKGRGRGLVARRNIKAGETIIAEEPLLLTVAQEAKDAACAHCLRLLTAGEFGGARGKWVSRARSIAVAGRRRAPPPAQRALRTPSPLHDGRRRPSTPHPHHHPSHP